MLLAKRAGEKRKPREVASTTPEAMAQRKKLKAEKKELKKIRKLDGELKKNKVLQNVTALEQAVDEKMAKSRPSKSKLKGLGRMYTVSIALPGSIINNTQSHELRTVLVGQVARIAAIFCVDEIVVFDDKLGKKTGVVQEASGSGDSRNDPNMFMARILQYMVNPKFIIKNYFHCRSVLLFDTLLSPGIYA